MDQLDAMRLLAAVVEAGSLSEPGRRLGLPLTTASRQIHIDLCNGVET